MSLFHMPKANARTALLRALMIAAALWLTLFVPSAMAADTAAGRDLSLRNFSDSAGYTLYVNEEVLVRSTSVWRADGSVFSHYTLTMAGQTLETTLKIACDTTGHWTRIDIQNARGPVTVERHGDTAAITSSKGSATALLKPGTALFENFTPVLMSQAVLAYDQKAGGKQTFPLFIIPAVVMDASLEKLDSQDRDIAGRMQTFTRYRYGAPGVDIMIWVDDSNHICLGDVPAQHGRYVRDGYEALALAPSQDSTVSQPRYGVTIDSNVQVPMRDGISLATDIYRPDTAGTFPIVLVRTPYDKKMDELQAKYFARRGYVYAVQDCRGRFGSAGTWRPFFNEPNDGYDAIEWLAVQPWSNGKVGMIGASYVGWVQWWAAGQRPPHLVTMIPNVSPPDPYYNIPYEYGSFFLFGAIWWADVLEQNATADLSGKAMSDIGNKRYAYLVRKLPVIELDKSVLGKENPYWREWIQHPNNDDYWAKASFLDQCKDIDIPVYHQSGWYDGDGIGSKLNYMAMAKNGHQNQKLVLGPWGHTAQAMRRGPNNTDFGPNAIIDLEASYLRWLDHWLLGIDNGIEKEPLVSLFVMGSNKWLHGGSYPLPETKLTNVYLTSGGKANSSTGDGRLSFEPPATSAAASDLYTYNPADPTPDPTFYFEPKDTLPEQKQDTAAQAIEEKLSKAFAFYGMIDSLRSDILVYDTEPLTDSLTIAGPVSAVLYAASSAKDTDWFMRLSAVNDSEVVFPLVHGTIRARFRNSMSTPELLEPNKIYEYKLDLWQTGIMVPPGSRLRVEVASASFPHFSRNLNTGGHNETETKFVSARQTIYHDAAHPSHIVLPVIPNTKTD